MENKFAKAETIGSIGCAERQSRSLTLMHLALSPLSVALIASTVIVLGLLLLNRVDPAILAVDRLGPSIIQPCK